MVGVERKWWGRKKATPPLFITKNDFSEDKKGPSNELIKNYQSTIYTLLTSFLPFSRREKKRVSGGVVGVEMRKNKPVEKG
ncbi:MAG: hypothetical protein LBQ39_06590 [Tannerellaceae bacterium]|nr:hypothetical protein [Tannerellaceae bacterium]